MWLVPRSCLSFQELVDSNSGSDSPCAGREYWVMSSGTPMLRPSSWRGWKTRPWSQHLFSSAMFKNWTDAISAVESISSAGAFPVRTSQSPVEEKALAASDQASGQRSSVWLMRYDRDTSSWKTSQRSLLEDLTPSLPTLPRSGSMRSGYVFERPTLVPRTGVSGGSAWPTPDTFNRKSRKALTASTDNARRSGGGNPSPPGLEQVAELHSGQIPPEMEGIDLPPKTRRLIDGERKGELLLAGQAQQWITPVAHDDNKSPEAHMAMKRRMKGGPRNTITSLAVQTRCFLPAPQTTAHGEPSSKNHPTSRRRLNPAFVAWLMGLPWWWTRAEPISFAAAEMQLYLSRLRSLLWSLCGECRGKGRVVDE